MESEKGSNIQILKNWRTWPIDCGNTTLKEWLLEVRIGQKCYILETGLKRKVLMGKLHQKSACLNLPVSIYLLKVNNGNTKPMCEICSKLTIETPERRQLCRSGSLLLTLNIFPTFFWVLLFLLWTSKYRLSWRRLYFKPY